MLVKLHGIFAEDYGPEYHIEANTVAEAVDGLTRQLRFYEDRPIALRPLVRIMGFDDPLLIYQKTEQKVIHLVPAMIGGGGVGKILIGAAIVAFAIWNPIGMSALFAAGVMSVGATLVMSGAMQLFMKSPTISKSKDPDASQYFGLTDNTVEIGTPIAIQYGRGPATGHVLAINVDSSDMVLGTFPATTS